MGAMRPYQLSIFAALLLTSCGSGTSGGSTSSDSAPSLTPSRSAAESASSGPGTPVRITFGATTLAARLNDTSTARGLADQLPLTLSFRDHASQEKIAPLPRGLPLDGVPEGDDPIPGDIGYWVPDESLVLYYGDVGFYNGIVRIGTFDGDRDVLERQSDGFQVRIERAD